MEKTATLNLRVSPADKQGAERVLEQLGIPMSTAITMYLRQIILTGGIPFAAKLPEAPDAINADRMSDAELASFLEDHLKSAKNSGTSAGSARAALLT